MAVELRIAGNVLGAGCVPPRRYVRCTWSASTLDKTGREHGARCDRPAKEGALRVHGWAMPTRSRPKRCITAAPADPFGPAVLLW
eukprot:5555197-Prymnesium_polylepis.1